MSKSLALYIQVIHHLFEIQSIEWIEYNSYISYFEGNITSVL